MRDPLGNTRIFRNFLINHSSLNYLCPSFACTRHALILLSRFHWLKVSIWVRECTWVIYGHSESSRSISWISCICSRPGITFLRDIESSWKSRKGKHQIGNNYLSDTLIDIEHARWSHISYSVSCIAWNKRVWDRSVCTIILRLISARIRSTSRISIFLFIAVFFKSFV